MTRLENPVFYKNYRLGNLLFSRVGVQRKKFTLTDEDLNVEIDAPMGLGCDQGPCTPENAREFKSPFITIHESFFPATEARCSDLEVPRPIHLVVREKIWTERRD
jgi:hypothetical protein